MSLEYIYVTRHAFRPPYSVDPATGHYSATIRSPTSSPADPPLAAYGLQQASDLAAHLVKLDPRIDRIYCSPYYRCLQTIRPFVAEFNRYSAQLPTPDSRVGRPRIRVEKGLGEWYGQAPFDHPSSAPLSRLQELFPDLDAEYASNITPPSNGEGLQQLHDRAAAVLDAIITRSDEEGVRAILICSHAAVVIALGRVLTGRCDHQIRAFTCGLSIYRRRVGGASQGSAAVAEHRREFAALSASVAASPVAAVPADPVDHQADDAQGFAIRVRWRDGSGVGGGWICLANSDCSFLRGGEERGWSFSDDESFSALGQRGLLSSERKPAKI